jgi:hypothetical protein
MELRFDHDDGSHVEITRLPDQTICFRTFAPTGELYSVEHCTIEELFKMRAARKELRVLEALDATVDSDTLRS